MSVHSKTFFVAADPKHPMVGMLMSNAAVYASTGEAIEQLDKDLRFVHSQHAGAGRSADICTESACETIRKEITFVRNLADMQHRAGVEA